MAVIVRETELVLGPAGAPAEDQAYTSSAPGRGVANSPGASPGQTSCTLRDETSAKAASSDWEQPLSGRIDRRETGSNTDGRQGHHRQIGCRRRWPPAGACGCPASGRTEGREALGCNQRAGEICFAAALTARGGGPAANPASVVVKIPTSNALAFRLARRLSLHRREYVYYRCIAPHSPVRVPSLFYGDFDHARPPVRSGARGPWRHGGDTPD